MKKTIAVIGTTESANRTVIKKLAALGYPLLLTGSEWENTKSCIVNEFPQSTVEVLDCSHECAWQADMVLLFPLPEQHTLLEKIKKVVTGKIIMEWVDEFHQDSIQPLLPFSKIVQVHASLNSDQFDFTVSGTHHQAVEHVMLLFDEIGFKSDKQ